MPGLKALTDRLPAGDTSRAVTLYTSSFSVGVGLSFLVAQLIADRWGWRIAFLVTGFGPVAMVIACLLMREQRPAPKAGRLLNFAPVFANREALGYILGYGAHCFELYGIRTWLVGFWTFVVAHQGAPSWLSPVVLSFCFAVISMPASILGNEAALKFGRHRAITVVMIASACVALIIGLSATAPAWVLALLLLAYGLTVPADSGALTAGMSAAAISEHRGATLALHSTVGFGLSAVGAWGTGAALDAAGGPQSATGLAAGVRRSCGRHCARSVRAALGADGSNASRLSQLYSCRHISTAEMTRIAANPGKRIEFGTTPSSKPPMNVPTIDPIAIASMNCQLARSTEKF
jgi:predicted MFS family arabinose efflux permease